MPAVTLDELRQNITIHLKKREFDPIFCNKLLKSLQENKESLIYNSLAVLYLNNIEFDINESFIDNLYFNLLKPVNCKISDFNFYYQMLIDNVACLVRKSRFKERFLNYLGDENKKLREMIESPENDIDQKNIYNDNVLEKYKDKNILFDTNKKNDNLLDTNKNDTVLDRDTLLNKDTNDNLLKEVKNNDNLLEKDNLLQDHRISYSDLKKIKNENESFISKIIERIENEDEYNFKENIPLVLDFLIENINEKNKEIISNFIEGLIESLKDFLFEISKNYQIENKNCENKNFEEYDFLLAEKIFFLCALLPPLLNISWIIPSIKPLIKLNKSNLIRNIYFYLSSDKKYFIKVINKSLFFNKIICETNLNDNTKINDNNINELFGNNNINEIVYFIERVLGEAYKIRYENSMKLSDQKENEKSDLELEKEDNDSRINILENFMRKKSSYEIKKITFQNDNFDEVILDNNSFSILKNYFLEIILSLENISSSILKEILYIFLSYYPEIDFLPFILENYNLNPVDYLDFLNLILDKHLNTSNPINDVKFILLLQNLSQIPNSSFFKILKKLPLSITRLLLSNFIFEQLRDNLKEGIEYFCKVLSFKKNENPLSRLYRDDHDNQNQYYDVDGNENDIKNKYHDNQFYENDIDGNDTDLNINDLNINDVRGIAAYLIRHSGQILDIQDERVIHLLNIVIDIKYDREILNGLKKYELNKYIPEYFQILYKILVHENNSSEIFPLLKDFQLSLMNDSVKKEFIKLLKLMIVSENEHLSSLVCEYSQKMGNNSSEIFYEFIEWYNFITHSERQIITNKGYGSDNTLTRQDTPRKDVKECDSDSLSLISMINSKAHSNELFKNSFKDSPDQTKFLLLHIVEFVDEEILNILLEEIYEIINSDNESINKQLLRMIISLLLTVDESLCHIVRESEICNSLSEYLKELGGIFNEVFVK